jgi:hypothetical protein
VLLKTVDLWTGREHAPHACLDADETGRMSREKEKKGEEEGGLIG